MVRNETRTPRDLMGWVLGNNACIRTDELAATMVDAAMNGSEELTMSDCSRMVLKGREVLQRV